MSWTSGFCTSSPSYHLVFYKTFSWDLDSEVQLPVHWVWLCPAISSHCRWKQAVSKNPRKPKPSGSHLNPSEHLGPTQANKLMVSLLSVSRHIITFTSRRKTKTIRITPNFSLVQHPSFQLTGSWIPFFSAAECPSLHPARDAKNCQSKQIIWLLSFYNPAFPFFWGDWYRVPTHLLHNFLQANKFLSEEVNLFFSSSYFVVENRSQQVFTASLTPTTLWSFTVKSQWEGKAAEMGPAMWQLPLEFPTSQNPYVWSADRLPIRLRRPPEILTCGGTGSYP